MITESNPKIAYNAINKRRKTNRTFKKKVGISKRKINEFITNSTKRYPRLIKRQ